MIIEPDTTNRAPDNMNRAPETTNRAPDTMNHAPGSAGASDEDLLCLVHPAPATTYPHHH